MGLSAIALEGIGLFTLTLYIGLPILTPFPYQFTRGERKYFAYVPYCTAGSRRIPNDPTLTGRVVRYVCEGIVAGK